MAHRVLVGSQEMNGHSVARSLRRLICEQRRTARGPPNHCGAIMVIMRPEESCRLQPGLVVDRMKSFRYWEPGGWAKFIAPGISDLAAILPSSSCRTIQASAGNVSTGSNRKRVRLRLSIILTSL